jgi:hypothetical protein
VDFACSLDGARAGAVALRETDGVLRLEVDCPWGRLTFPQFNLVTVLDALSRRSAAALYALDHELAPFWCPACSTTYCGAHWDSWDVWDEGFFDQTRGRCPRGHERMLLE